ncbi:hypothetical protein ElyMa_000031000 [Elysia marginata]|uniref:Uncharacterized protein n=1 Tax=Elysia marginata TaxID=1093978 RepID=A0AAV4ECF8_9GAST|nr:hypothetical protein ElyMa_000031000 [Elysia marginata]
MRLSVRALALSSWSLNGLKEYPTDNYSKTNEETNLFGSYYFIFDNLNSIVVVVVVVIVVVVVKSIHSAPRRFAIVKHRGTTIMTFLATLHTTQNNGALNKR